MSDKVTNPDHYAKWAIEPVVFIMENGLDYPTGNIIKYVVRWRDKGGLRDLYKARSYLDRMIAKAEGKEYGRGVDPRPEVPRPSKEWTVHRDGSGVLVASHVRAGSSSSSRRRRNRNKARR